MVRILVDTKTEGARRKEEADKKLLTFFKEGGRAKINTEACIIIIFFSPLSAVPLHLLSVSVQWTTQLGGNQMLIKEKIAFDRGEQNRKETPREPPQRSGHEGGEPEREKKNGQERDSGVDGWRGGERMRKYGC